MHRRRQVLKPFAVALAAVAAAAGLSACGGDSGPSVTIYSGRTRDLIHPLLVQFSEETGIHVDVRYEQSADLALVIDEEGERTQADVFLSQSPGAVGYLEQRGRLAALPDDILELVPAEVRSEAGTWVGVSGRERVLVYNTEAVEEAELPESVFDLTQPQWRGRVGVAPPNGSFQDFVTAMRAAEGDDATLAWLRGLADNDAQTYPNNNAIVAAVDRGEIDVGLVNHYYGHRFAEEEGDDYAGANHRFGGDDIGSLLLVTAASLVEGAPHPEEALELIRFLLSPEAQRYLSTETFEYPLAEGAEPADVLPPADFTTGAAIDFDRLGGGLEATRELIRQSGLER